MACLGLRSNGGITVRADRVKMPGQGNQVRVTPTRCLAAKAMAVKCSATAVQVGQGGRTHMRGEPEKLDRWVKESVGEIVKNLGEAPLFVHVYSGAGTRLKTEKAVAEEWCELKGKWVKGEEASPEGIILVEELKEEEEDSTKAWGLLIQGKGEDGGVACYLLKTSKVGCGNLGLFCTHYCLVRVKSFRETARSQLTTCWLA